MREKQQQQEKTGMTWWDLHILFSRVYGDIDHRDVLKRNLFYLSLVNEAYIWALLKILKILNLKNMRTP